jgi:multidrug resistance efflux pump
MIMPLILRSAVFVGLSGLLVSPMVAMVDPPAPTQAASAGGAVVPVVAPAAGASSAAAPTVPAPKTATVERGTLELIIERPGRVESARSDEVRLELEAFSGPVTVKDIVRRSGAVKAGDALVTLEGKEFDKGLEDLRIQAAETQRRFAMQKEERAMQVRQTIAGLERAALAAELAQQALELHRDYDSKKDLGLKASLDGLRDNQDELTQLEKMYAGTSLQSETKDIVLDRARRGVERGEIFAKYARRDNEIYKAIRAPNDARRIEDQAKYSKLDLESAQIQQRLGEIRAELDLASSARSLRDIERRLEKMEGDAVRMSVKAPSDGYVVVRVKDVGDQLQPRQELAQVVDLSKLRVRGTMNADALRVVKQGDIAAVWFPARPEIRAEAVIDELVIVGTPEGDGAAFPFVATLRSMDGSVFPGVEARLVLRGTLADRVLVPTKAMKQDKGRFTVKVLSGATQADREVRVGASDGTKTEVLSGLQAGEQVVMPDA